MLATSWYEKKKHVGKKRKEKKMPVDSLFTNTPTLQAKPGQCN